MSNQTSTQLQVTGASIAAAKSSVKAEAGHGGQPLRHLLVEVANKGNQPLHVWTTRRAYEYDAATHQLTLYLTEHTPPLPPGIEMISNHPRTPQVVEVAGKGHATLELAIPALIRRRIPGEGRGMSFVEEQIGQVAKVVLHIQSATEPPPDLAKADPAEHRQRLRDHGGVLQVTVTPGAKAAK